MNDLFISDCNSIRWYELTPNQSAEYLTRRFDDYPFIQQIKRWQTPKKYVQKWSTNDPVPIQFESDFSPIQINIVDKKNQTVRVFALNQMAQSIYDATRYVYETVLDFTGLPDGCYGGNMYVAGQLVPYAFTEPFHLKPVWDDTLCFDYSSTEVYHQGVLFRTGIVFRFRVEGTLDYPIFGANANGFIDQQQNPVITNSVPTVKYPCVIGGSFGVPPWVVSILSNIFSCDNVLIDGKPYGKEPDEEFTYNDVDNYPLKGVSFDLMDGNNRPGKIMTPAINTNKKFGVIFNITGPIFGELTRTGPLDTISITGTA